MKFLEFRKAVPVFACTVFTVVSGFASPILVSNFSFENLPPGGLPNVCGSGCSYSSDGVVPGWTVTPGAGAVGEFRPGTPGNLTYFNSVPDGSTIAYSNGGIISQIVGSVQIGVVYTLQVEVGQQKGQATTAVTSLVIGGGPTVVATGVTPTAGNWSTYTATYIGQVADFGKPITIQLNAASTQGDWDNVRFDATAVPEPATFLFLGAGLIGLAGARRFRRA